MVTKSVDIKALHSVFPEHIHRFYNFYKSDIIEKILLGTDLEFNSKIGYIQEKGCPGRAFKLQDESAYLSALREEASKDGNKDELSIEEAQAFKEKYLSNKPEITADKFLHTLEGEMQRRYRPWAKNAASVSPELKYLPLFDVLDQSVHGLYVTDEVHSVEYFSSPGKALMNSAHYFGYLFVQPMNWVADTIAGPLKQPGIYRPTDVSDLGDRVADARSFIKYQERRAAVYELARVLRVGIEKKEPWAMNGDISVALNKVSPENVKILEEELAIRELGDLFQTKNKDEFYQKIFDFAKKEIEIGHARDANWFNWNGSIVNVPLAYSLLYFLGGEATLSSPKKTKDFLNEVELFFNTDMESRRLQKGVTNFNHALNLDPYPDLTKPPIENQKDMNCFTPLP